MIYGLCIFSEKKAQAQEKHNETKTDNSGVKKIVIGGNYGGGKIFWIDETGLHGLIAASGDQSSKGIAWNPGKGFTTGANSDEIYSGLKNSEKIFGAQGNSGQYAAKTCLDLTIKSNGVEYSDWYLPSKNELNLLYQQRAAIGGFNVTGGIYWSSTESSSAPETSAWEQEFKFGSQLEDDKDVPDQVRCIRKF